MPISRCIMEFNRKIGKKYKKEPSGQSEGSFCRSIHGLLAIEVAQTHIADVFPLVRDDVPGIPAENAGGLILVEDDRGAVNIDLKGVALRNVQGPAELDGQNDTSQFIDLTNNSGCFHK